PASPLPAVTPKQVHVRFAAEPADARLYLDDTELATIPYEADVARDASTHKLRAEARGYSSRSVIVSFANDADVVLRLEKAPQTKERTKASAPPSPPPPSKAKGKPEQPKPPAEPTPATAAPTPAPRTPPGSHSLDETNPFR